jgi:lipopolysaccharide biosynthesis protein
MIDATDCSKAPVTVLAHVHYPDIWRDMSALLSERLAVPFHLALTSSLPEAEIVVPRTPALLSTQFLRVENRGRDILPFLRSLAGTQDFEFGLKLHTKKSPQREDGALWRAELLESLLPPADGVVRMIRRMQSDHRIGLVTPAGFCLSVKPWILQNDAGLNRIMSALGADLGECDLENVFFAAGSMFWFRRSALLALTTPNLPALFEPEEGQLDGTIAHAMERLFPVEARRQGYVSLAVTALMSSDPRLSLTELLELARGHADVPSRYFPGPYVPALPLAIPPVAQSASFDIMARLAAFYRSTLPEKLRLRLRRLMGRPLPRAIRSG